VPGVLIFNAPVQYVQGKKILEKIQYLNKINLVGEGEGSGSEAIACLRNYFFMHRARRAHI
jgi:hypothetical protein